MELDIGTADMAMLREMNLETSPAEPYRSPLNRHWSADTWLLGIGIVLLLASASWLLNPYQFDDSHTTRYYLPVIRALDTRLFPVDPVVSSISKFRSWFYDAISLACRAAHVTPQELPGFLKALYAISLLACFAFIGGIARTLDRSLTAVALLGLMCLRPMGAIVGGDGLFAPTLTHKEASTLLALAVFWSILSKRYFLGLVLLSACVYIHALTALHIAWCIVPVLLIKQPRFSGRLLAGLAVLSAAFGIYYVIAAGGIGFDSEAARLFVANKGSINHIALGSQGKIQWLLILGVLFVAAASRRYLLDGRDTALWTIEQFWISGSMICVAVSAMFSLTGDFHFALFQPLRCFVWVMYLALIEIAIAAVKLRKQDGFASAILIAVIGFKVAGVFLWVPFLGIAIVYLSARLIGLIKEDTAVAAVKIVAVTMLLATTAGFVFRSHVPLESLRSPMTLVLCAIAVACIFVLGSKASVSVQLGSAALFLALCSWSVHAKPNPPIDANWAGMAYWVENNTQFFDQGLTPPETEEFRNLSYRSPVSEPMNALWWVNPKLEALLEARASRVRQLCKDGVCDCQSLEELAHAWGARYFITQGTCQQSRQPAFRANSYNLYLLSGSASSDRVESRTTASFRQSHQAQ